MYHLPICTRRISTSCEQRDQRRSFALVPARDSLIFEMLFPDKVVRELHEKSVQQADSCSEFTQRILEIASIPCKILCWQGIYPETGAISTAAPVWESCSNCDIPMHELPVS